MNADVIFGLQWGDEGKGKCTSALLKQNKYDYVCRWNGGNNAGHTVFLNGKKFKTHLIPSGIFHGIKSYIGPGCILHPESFFNEINYLDNNGFDTSVIKVHPNTNIIKNIHINMDKNFHTKTQGSTSKGIAPCYGDKYNRKGLLAKQIRKLSPFIADIDLMECNNILCEGAQGIELDIDYGKYPYVTSSHCLPWATCSLGFTHKNLRHIYGIAKCYTTRSGLDPYYASLVSNDEIKTLDKLAELGNEYGVTTGRRRATNWLDLNLLIKAINKTAVTHLIVNKFDILQELNIFKLYHNTTNSNTLKQFQTLSSFQNYVKEIIELNCNINTIIFSNHQEYINRNQEL